MNSTVLISSDLLLNLNVNRFAPYIPPCYLHFFFGIPGVAPYRLLSYFSTLFFNRTLVEIGTHNGWGSLALTYNPTNQVVGFDVDLSTLSPAIRDIPGTVFHEGLAHEIAPDLVLSSPFIHFDALHDGVYERVFFDFLVAHEYKGIVLWDDIHLNPEMGTFWENITLPKTDLTAFGHSTGTGLVHFNGSKS